MNGHNRQSKEQDGYNMPTPPTDQEQAAVNEAAPLDTNFSYAWERLSFTQFGQPQWTQVGQMTPATIAFGSTLYLPSGEANLIRTRKLIPPAK
jgi:hypothetical protein